MSMKATAAKKRAPKARTMLAMRGAGTRGATAKALDVAAVSANGKYTVGKCSALGSGCTLENLQNNRSTGTSVMTVVMESMSLHLVEEKWLASCVAIPASKTMWIKKMSYISTQVTVRP